MVSELQELLFVYIYSFMFIDLFNRRCNLKSIEFSKQFMHLKTLLNLHYLFCVNLICTCIRKEFVELLIFSIVTVFHSG